MVKLFALLSSCRMRLVDPAPLYIIVSQFITIIQLLSVVKIITKRDLGGRPITCHVISDREFVGLISPTSYIFLLRWLSRLT